MRNALMITKNRGDESFSVMRKDRWGSEVGIALSAFIRIDGINRHRDRGGGSQRAERASDDDRIPVARSGFGLVVPPRILV